MILMDDKVIRENIEGYSRQVHLKQARSFVATVPDEPFVAPNVKVSLSHVNR
jgi:hypothetical protein